MVRIGQAIAKRAQGFDLRVIYHSPNAEPAYGAQPVDLDTLLHESDFVSINVPLKAETRHLVNAKFLAKMKPGDAILVHAAAGGMGVILSQWARALGAIVIGTVGSDEKAAVALAHGCHHVINYRSEDFVARTLDLTQGEGVAVVYDAVGKDVFVPSLQCLRTLGLAINYGTASGDVEGLDLHLLHARSLSICRPTLRSFIASPADLQRGAQGLFEAMQEGHVRLEVKHRYPFTDVRRAHRELEGRLTTGAPVLIPETTA